MTEVTLDHRPREPRKVTTRARVLVVALAFLAPSSLIAAAHYLSPSRGAGPVGADLGNFCAGTGSIQPKTASQFSQLQWFTATGWTFEAAPDTAKRWQEFADESAVGMPADLIDYFKHREPFVMKPGELVPLNELAKTNAAEVSSGRIVVDQIQMEGLQSLAPQIAYISVNNPDGAGDSTVSAIAASGSSGATLIGYCGKERTPEFASAVAEAGSAGKSGDESQSAIGAFLAATTTTTTLQNVTFDQRDPRHRSFIDDYATLSDEMKKSLVAVKIEAQLPSSWKGQPNSICFRTVTAWSGCFNLDALDPDGRITQSVPTLPGEDIEIVLNNADASYDAPTQVQIFTIPVSATKTTANQIVLYRVDDSVSLESVRSGPTSASIGEVTVADAGP